jgi:hypothetical protein
VNHSLFPDRQKPLTAHLTVDTCCVTTMPASSHGSTNGDTGHACVPLNAHTSAGWHSVGVSVGGWFAHGHSPEFLSIPGDHPCFGAGGRWCAHQGLRVPSPALVCSPSAIHGPLSVSVWRMPATRHAAIESVGFAGAGMVVPAHSFTLRGRGNDTVHRTAARRIRRCADMTGSLDTQTA